MPGGRFTRMANWTGFNVQFNLKQTQSSQEMQFVEGRYCACVFTARGLNTNAAIHRAGSQGSGLGVVGKLRAWMCKEEWFTARQCRFFSSCGPTQHLTQRVPGNTSAELKAATHLI